MQKKEHDLESIQKGTLQMQKLIQAFPQHLEEALKHIDTWQLPAFNHDLHHVVIVGLGGSGIAGRLIQQWLMHCCMYPIILHQNYTLPHYINKHTLLLLNSYSGNTAEIIASLDQGLKLKAHIICITAGGGILMKKIQQHRLPCIMLPNGFLPRTCLGFVIVQQLAIMHYYQMMDFDYKKMIKKAAYNLNKTQKLIQKEAKEVAKKLQHKITVVYTSINHEPIAIRLRQQINENSKQVCWHHVYPELNHNEIVGWHQRYPGTAIIFLCDEADSLPIRLSSQITRAMLAPYTDEVIPIYAPNDCSSIEKSLYLIHVCDWISYYLAQYNDINPVSIAAIDYMKVQLRNRMMSDKE